MFRNIPDRKYIAKASKVPIAADKSKAVETEGRSFLSPIPPKAVHQLFQIENEIQYSGSFILCFIFFFFSQCKWGTQYGMLWSSREEILASVVVSPELDSLLALFDMSSATNDVATLRRGILKTFDMMLKIDIERPADANSKGPFQMDKTKGLFSIC